MENTKKLKCPIWRKEEIMKTTTATPIKRRKKSYNKAIRRTLYKAVYKLACFLDAIDYEKLWKETKDFIGQLIITFIVWGFIIFLLYRWFCYGY